MTHATATSAAVAPGPGAGRRSRRGARTGGGRVGIRGGHICGYAGGGAGAAALLTSVRRPIFRQGTAGRRRAKGKGHGPMDRVGQQGASGPSRRRRTAAPGATPAGAGARRCAPRVDAPLP